MEGQQFTNWELIILVNLVERELKNARDRDKEAALSAIRTKLLAISLGEKPFNIDIRI